MLTDDRAAITRASVSLVDRAARIKAMCADLGLTIRLSLTKARNLGEELWAAKDHCIREYKPWYEWLDQSGIGRDTATKYIRLYKYWTAIITHEEFSSNMGVMEALSLVARHREEPEPEASSPAPTPTPAPTPAAGQASSREPSRRPAGAGPRPPTPEPEREAGDDTPEPAPPSGPVRVAAARLTKIIDGISSTRQVDVAEVNLLKARITALIAAIDRLAASPVRNAPAPRPAKCRRCGCPVLWVRTEAGKLMPLEATPGGGQFELVNNRPIMVRYVPGMDSSRLYRNHHIRCHPGKA